MIKKIFLIVIVIISLFHIYINYYEEKSVIMSTSRNKNVNKTLSLMYETEYNSGVFVESNDVDWPGNRDFILELSGCENGSQIIWDNVNKTVAVKGNISDKCYLYFGAINEDVRINLSYDENHSNIKYSNTIKSVNCNVSSVEWDNKISGIRVNYGNNDHIKCDVNISNQTSVKYLNNFLNGNYDDKPVVGNNGILIQENGLRYEGINPNNYLWFNDELWRIIGVFQTEYDTTNDGNANATANLVKIMREESIGAFVYDKDYTNDWTNSSLHQLLNEGYYDWNTYKNGVSNYCFGYLNVGSVGCDFSIKGIKDDYRNMIAKAKWYLGGPGKAGYETYYPNYVYSYERDSNSVLAGNSASIVDNVGLLYLSDFAYSAPGSTCTRESYSIILKNDTTGYPSPGCSGKSWIHSYGHEWTITPYSLQSIQAFFINYDGNSNFTDTYYGLATRPALYLNPTVYLISGTGTITDPYIVGI